MADQHHDATGTPAAGVPVVDLSGLLRGLLEHAEASREARGHALALAASLGREADYLEDLARILGGNG